MICPLLLGGQVSRHLSLLLLLRASPRMLLTACSEKSFVVRLDDRQWHLLLLFAGVAAMFEFGGNHVPALDTPEFK
jgi:hypothetical protein